MSSVNKVFLMGNLTAEPDVRGLPTGQQICNLRIAVNREYTNTAGQRVSDTCYVVVSVYGKTATSCKQFLYKGAKVFVEGRLQLEQWTGKDGQDRQKLKVVAENIQFCDKPRFERTPPRPPVDGEYAPERREHYQAKADGYQPDNESEEEIPW